MIMKKIILVILVLVSAQLIQAQNRTVYTLTFNSLNKGNIKMDNYKGRKIIVVVCDAVTPDIKQLLSLDSFYRNNNKKVIVVAVPVEDFHSNSDEQKLKETLIDQLSISYPVAAISKAKKSTGKAQHKLLEWLTKKEINKKMDKDVQGDGEIFVLNEKGELYARIDQKIGISHPFFSKVLSKAVPQK